MRADTVQELSMRKEALQPKVWTKPQLKRLGEIKNVRQGSSPSTANGGMS